MPRAQPRQTARDPSAFHFSRTSRALFQEWQDTWLRSSPQKLTGDGRLSQRDSSVISWNTLWKINLETVRFQSVYRSPKQPHILKTTTAQADAIEGSLPTDSAAYFDDGLNECLMESSGDRGSRHTAACIFCDLPDHLARIHPD